MASFFIINPAAGRGRARRLWERLQPRLGGLGDWAYALTAMRGEATSLATKAAQQGFDRVVAVGGDGTLNEVVAGLVGTTANLALVPAGTGNDYGRGIGIPMDPVAAAQLALTGQGHPVDVGEVHLGGQVQRFINVAGIGFDAEVARAVNACPKWLGGTVPYLIGVLRTLGGYRPVNMTITADGRQMFRTVFLAAVAVSRYYGGGMMIAPQAQVDDGAFDVCIAGNIGRAEALALVPKIYSGGHVGHPKVEFLRCQEIEFTPERSLSVHADGELIGDQPVRFRLLPGALRVIR